MEFVGGFLDFDVVFVVVAVGVGGCCWCVDCCGVLGVGFVD